MNRHYLAEHCDEKRVVFLAEVLALYLRAGDLVTLSGDLGAGKSTFARALVRAVLDDPDAEVPSPTFSLVQGYATPRFTIGHLDLYRLSSPDEVSELGLDEILSTGVAVVEWPERGSGVLPVPALAITFADPRSGNVGPDTRTLTFATSASFADRLARLVDVLNFIQPDTATGPLPTIRYLQGDASPRAYARIISPSGSRILMDSPRRPDGPPVRDGLPYSRVAHLAEDVGPFVAVGTALHEAGFSVPDIYATDLDRGLMLIEDLGDRVFGAELAAGTPQATLWRAATETLVELRAFPATTPFPFGRNEPYRLPPFDRPALAIETELLLDWLWPLVKGTPAPASAREAYAAAWEPVFDRLLAHPPGLVLRDYHSPNLIWLPDRDGARRTGILDFQDAVLGHPAYDLVSLLQDARVDVPADLEAELFAHYLHQVARREPRFDQDDFGFAYAALGAQRNSKILGIFARLAMRDGKGRYLAHLPRIWGYLNRSLSHAALAPLAAWYEHHWPQPDRAPPVWPGT